MIHATATMIANVSRYCRSSTMTVILGRNEKNVEGQHGEHGRGNGRTAIEAQRHDDHRQQIDHRDVDPIERSTPSRSPRACTQSWLRRPTRSLANAALRRFRIVAASMGDFSATNA